MSGYEEMVIEAVAEMVVEQIRNWKRDGVTAPHVVASMTTTEKRGIKSVTWYSLACCLGRWVWQDSVMIKMNTRLETALNFAIKRRMGGP